ncbi:hypothetical protein HG531_010556 [Fusarium graminearum]|nr:hypothetical protein HG531_010556 [Fusarium graminearum]
MSIGNHQAFVVEDPKSLCVSSRRALARLIGFNLDVDLAVFMVQINFTSKTSLAEKVVELDTNACADLTLELAPHVQTAMNGTLQASNGIIQVLGLPLNAFVSVFGFARTVKYLVIRSSNTRFSLFELFSKFGVLLLDTVVRLIFRNVHPLWYCLCRLLNELCHLYCLMLSLFLNTPPLVFLNVDLFESIILLGYGNSPHVLSSGNFLGRFLNLALKFLLIVPGFFKLQASLLGFGFQISL